VKLFPVRGRNTYCGPAVVSALTGLRTEDTARLLRAVSGESRAVGITPPVLLQALQALKFHVERYQVIPFEARPYPLGDWLATAPVIDGAWLIATDSSRPKYRGGHWQVVAGGELACSYYRDPVLIGDLRKRHRRQSLLAVWFVTARWFPG
jgi:hypothetical protein